MNLPLRAQSLEIQDAGDDVLVHDRTRRSVHVLNRSAGEVLRACDGKTSIRALAERFDAERADEIEHDIRRVIDDFTNLGLLSA